MEPSVIIMNQLQTLAGVVFSCAHSARGRSQYAGLEMRGDGSGFPTKFSPTTGAASHLSASAATRCTLPLSTFAGDSAGTKRGVSAD